MNDKDRSQWIDNDEGLYRWWCGSRMSKRAFIQTYRDVLTKYINAALGRRETAMRQEIINYHKSDDGE